MKKIMLMAAILMASVVANAQNEVGQISVAPTVGLNLANFSGKDIDGNKMKLGPVIGVTAEYGLTEKLGITAGLHFSLQGAKFEFEDEGETEKFTDKMNYLNIPIMANYYVWESLALKAGIQPAFLLSAKSDDEDIKDACNTFDFSIPVGASYEISNFVIDARYNIPLTKITKGSGTGFKNSVFQLTLSYKFKL